MERGRNERQNIKPHQYTERETWIERRQIQRDTEKERSRDRKIAR